MFLVLAGPQKVTQNLAFNAGRDVAMVARRLGDTVTAKVASSATLDSTKSTPVRFKVVAPRR